ncbi:hypothetical protein FKM82_028118 [Ascaphus truei]
MEMFQKTEEEVCNTLLKTNKFNHFPILRH